MTLSVKLFIISSAVLLGSFYLFQSMDSDQFDEFAIWLFYKSMNLALLMDSLFQGINYPGFYRQYESMLSKQIFSKLNTSDLKFEKKDFGGVNVFIFDSIKRKSNGPAIVYIHGGGFNFLDPMFYSHFTADIARRLNLMVVSVDYRRSPEHPFPVPVNDAIAATKYFLDNAEKFDVDPNRVALMGDSAAGNLVVVVGYQLMALRRTNNSTRVPKAIVPLYPTLQMADLSFPSLRKEDEDSILPKKDIPLCFCKYAIGEVSQQELDQCVEVLTTNRHLNKETVEKIKDNIDWKKYLKGREYENIEKTYENKFTPNPFVAKFSQLILDPRYSPMSALNDSELAIFPPIYLVVSLKDPLRDDGRLFAKRLSRVGRLGGYKEYDHYHIHFILAQFGSEKSRQSFDAATGFFTENNIL